MRTRDTLSTNNEVTVQNGHLAVSQETQMIRLEELLVDLMGQPRFREKDCEKTIERYKKVWLDYLAEQKTEEDAVRKGEQRTTEPVTYPFPAIHVFKEGTRFSVYDGRHRLQAALRAGIDEIQCIVHTDKKAITLIAIQSNRHGLNPNGRDKAKCIEVLRREYPDMAGRRIASEVGCSESYVRKVFKKLHVRTSAQGEPVTEKKVTPKKKPRPTVPSLESLLDTMKVAIEEANRHQKKRPQAIAEGVKTLIEEGFPNKTERERLVAELRALLGRY